MNEVKKRVYEILKKDTRLWNNEELNETLLFDLVDKIDTKLIEILLEDKLTREKFFIKIKDVYVFNSNDFRFFIEENKLDNSYTKYKNRIGLTDKKRFLKDTNDIVLNFPYKDCILEGGQSTEEGYDYYYEYDEKITKTDKKNGYKANNYNLKKAKRKEIFFNEVLAKDEIDRLLDEKAFCNFKRFSGGGVEELVDFNRDKEINKKRNLPLDTITDNLIIKGNNLLALHSLKKEFANKVKLIYIDPPYNTDSEANTFKYNNNFNHSTWLTFMKNRLEVAKTLLKDDGIIIIDIDHFELFYLGVLCDEIFGKDNRLGILAVQHNPGGRDNEFFANSHENKLVYAKNKLLAKIYNLELSEEDLKKYNKEDEISKYYEIGLQRTGDGSRREDRPNLFFPIYYNEKTYDISLEKKDAYIEIYPVDDNGVERRWRWNKEKIKKYWKTEIIVKKIQNKYKIYTKNRLTKRDGKKAKTLWFEKKYAGTNGTESLKILFGEKVFSYPKSPFMVKDTLIIATQPNDIVLDFHLGSGTTAAVAHKMNRQYIGIEQMDYIETIAVERLKKVIDGEQGGISKAVNWQGGGSFVYFELAKWNEKAKDEILNKNSLDELIEFFDEMYEKYFLNYNLKIKEFKEKVINENEFKNLSLDKQKEMFITMLDNNQIYINKSEMEDELYNLSQKDIELTKKFYKG